MSPTCFKQYLRARGWQHVSVDKWRTGNPHDHRDVGFVDIEVDIADMRLFAAGAFDLVIAQHVIEEVPDAYRALDEVRRVLSAGGLALLEIPHDKGLERSASQTPNHFGNLWSFGRDLLDELGKRFNAVESRALREGDYRGEIFACHV